MAAPAKPKSAAKPKTETAAKAEAKTETPPPVEPAPKVEPADKPSRLNPLNWFRRDEAPEAPDAKADKPADPPAAKDETAEPAAEDVRVDAFEIHGEPVVATAGARTRAVVGALVAGARDATREAVLKGAELRTVDLDLQIAEGTIQVKVEPGKWRRHCAFSS